MDVLTITDKGENMRKVVSWLFISLDGVAEAPNEWQFDVMDDDMIAAITAQMDSEGAMLMGRVSYQEWASYWPASTDEPYASHINNMPKYVVSTTLDDVAWGKWEKPTLIKGDLAKEINKLKQQPGKVISVGGSPTLMTFPGCCFSLLISVARLSLISVGFSHFPQATSSSVVETTYLGILLI